MMFDVTIYCPDTHILYNAKLIDKKGLGGGLIGRILMAQALAQHGHRVTVIANVTHPYRHRGVEYIPLTDAALKTKTDILIMSSSGGALSLEPAVDLKLDAEWRGIRIGSVPSIHGLDKFHWDSIIPQSNFIRDVIANEWYLERPKQFVIYQGVFKKRSGRWLSIPHRDPFRLIYTSHPDKGLSAAIAVLEKLRAVDKRYHLFVYGSEGIYGGEDLKPSAQAGITYFGARKNAKILSALETALVSFQLQARLEPFGKVLTESMLHGAIPLASPVGAYPELVTHGQNGILIEDDYLSDEAHSLAAEWILRLNQDPQLAAYIRRNAMNIPWDWDTMAKVWAGHWEWVIHRKGTILPDRQRCTRCDGGLLSLADGYHCIECGWYHQNLAAVERAS
jgi:glycosyltransferase involved in cell wall biosynthesis